MVCPAPSNVMSPPEVDFLGPVVVLRKAVGHVFAQLDVGGQDGAHLRATEIDAPSPYAEAALGVDDVDAVGLVVDQVVLGVVV